MPSNAFFYVLWEALSVGTKLSFKFVTQPESPKLVASVVLFEDYKFFLAREGEIVAQHKVSTEEARQRLWSLVENRMVHTVSVLPVNIHLYHSFARSADGESWVCDK